MIISTTTQQIYSLLADIVSYPQADLETSASQCAELLEGTLPAAGKAMREFLAFVEKEPLGTLEEIYTSTFDMNPLCPPYIGYYLFGDTHKRGDFLVRLKNDYRVYDFAVEGELPDHLSVMLQFLAINEDEQSARVLIGETMVPAIDEMERKAAKAGGAYHHVIRTIQLIFRQEMEKELPGGPNNV